MMIIAAIEIIEAMFTFVSLVSKWPSNADSTDLNPSKTLDISFGKAFKRDVFKSFEVIVSVRLTKLF